MFVFDLDQALAEQRASLTNRSEALPAKIEYVVHACDPAGLDDTVVVHRIGRGWDARAEALLSRCAEQDIALCFVSAGTVADLPLIAIMRKMPGMLLLLEDGQADPRIISRLAEAAVAVSPAAPDMRAAGAALAVRQGLLRDFARAAAAHNYDAAGLLTFAYSLSRLRRAARTRILFDVTQIARRDLGSGVQRVTKEIARQLAEDDPLVTDFIPVRVAAIAGKTVLVRHDDFLDSMLGRFPLGPWPGEVIDPGEGDILLNVDVNLEGTVRLAAEGHFAAWRSQGLRTCFLIHDLLPLERPADFSGELPQKFSEWIAAVCAHADLLLVTTGAGKAALSRRLSDLALATVPEIAVVPLGADFATRDASRKLPAVHSEYVLMVGTLEPRKGYEQAIGAFEHLWRTGSRRALVIAGRAGWDCNELVRRIEHHGELGHRLFWFRDATDDVIADLYRSADGLLGASHAEGFGLPLVEAAHFGVPLLLRDIPVFRDVAADGAEYFTAHDGAALADAIGQWLEKIAAGQAPASVSLRAKTWKASAQALRAALRMLIEGQQS